MTLATAAAAAREANWIVEWTPDPEVRVDSWRIYTRQAETGDAWSLHSEVMEPRANLAGLVQAGHVEIAIAAVADAVEAPEELWEVSTFYPADPTDLPVPQAVSNFAAHQDGSLVRCVWDIPTSERVAEVEIREGSSWEAGLVMATFRATDGIGHFAAWSSGSKTYRARFLTTDGIRSDAEASTAITIRDDPYWVEQAEVDESGGGFTATKDNTAVVSSELRLEAYLGVADNWTDVTDNYTSFFGNYPTEGTYTSAVVDVGSVVTERIDVETEFTMSKDAIVADDWSAPMRSSVDASGDALDPDALSVYSYVTADNELIFGLEIIPEVRFSQTGTAPAGDYARWVPGAEYTFRQVQMRYTLRCPYPWMTPSISTLKWRRRRQNLKEDQVVTVSGTGGTAVTYVSPFSTTPVIPTARVAGQPKWYVAFTAVSATGCTIEVYDDSDVEQGTATVHLFAAGV